MALPLSPPDEKVLRVLWNKGPQTPAKAGADPATASRLTMLGLLAEVPGASRTAKPRLTLTDRGRQIAADLPPASAKAGDLLRAVLALRDEVRALRAMLGGHDGEASRPEPGSANATGRSEPPHLQAGLGRDILRALHHVNARDRLGGLVPLPALRRQLAPLGIARTALDAALLEAEQRYEIDLKVANDRSALADASEGIEVTGRGLLYFVVAR